MSTVEINPGQLNQSNALTFITAGHAVFTIRKRINLKMPRHYLSLGFLRQYNGTWRFTYGNKSKISEGAKSVQAINFVINSLLSIGLTHPDLEIWHEGHCGRCGKPLTDPESIHKGIGPICDGIRLRHRNNFKV